MTGEISRAYAQLVGQGELKPDPAPQRAAAALDRLDSALRKRSGLLRLFGRTDNGPAGVYLWGGVGRGKSMLMDLAFDTIRF